MPVPSGLAALRVTSFSFPLYRLPLSRYRLAATSVIHTSLCWSDRLK